MTDPFSAATGIGAGSTRSLAPADDPSASLSGDGAAPAADPTVDPSEALPDAGPPIALPGYELLEEVGRGGMGVVYRAREGALNRHVAVKVLQPRFPADGPATARFLEEAQITGQLQHPGIPPVHHVGTLPDGRPFLVMKLIKGNTLEELLKERADPAADRGRFVAVFEQVCQAVACAHARQVIHRDLKPANVMVGSFGEVQVMDWGLAKTLTAPAARTEVPDDPPSGATVICTLRDSEGSFTQAGSVLGTPAFMPPEQAGGEIDRIDERSDVFGLGAILCVISTGKPPYSAKDSEAVRLLAIRGQLEECLARLDACGAEPELVLLAKRCLAANPADRPRNAGEVAAAVAGLRAAADERARQAELEKVRAEGELRAAEVRTAEQWKRRKVQAALGLAFTALVVLGGAFAWWQDRQAAERRAERDRDEADRRAEAERGVNRAVEDAVAKFGRATGAERDLALWAEARAAALQADARAAEAGAPPEVRDRTRRLIGEIEQVEKNRRLVAALLDIHAGMGDNLTPFGDQDFAGADARYARAFRDYGTDLFAMPPEQGAELLQNLGGDVRVDLAAAIDDWGYVRYYLSRMKLDDAARLFQVTRLLDPDPMRNRIRAIVAAGDRAALGRLAEELDPAVQPIQTLNLVAVYLYWFLGNTGEGPRAAGQFLQKAQPHHPGEFQINHNLAFFLNRERRYAQALPYSAAAIAVRPRSAAAWQDQAMALEGLGRTADAVAAYRRICALAPNTIFARRRLADLLTATGDRAGAATVRRELVLACQEVVRRAPKNAAAHYYLGNALRDADQLDEAEAAYREAVRLDGDHHGAAIGELAALLKTRGKLVEAVAVYREIVRIAPGYALAHNNLAWALAAGPDGVRDGKKAVEHATKACELTGWKQPIYLDTLAAAHAEAGDFDKAVEHQTKALSFPEFMKQHGAAARHRLELYTRKTPYRDPALARRELAPPPRAVQ